MTSIGKAHRRDSASRTTTKVLIVDDHPMIQQAIADEVQRNPGWSVCGEASDWASAIELARQTQPDIAVIDLRLETGHGLDLIGMVREQVPHIACLVYSMLDEKLYARRALEAGARGYLNKRASLDEISTALRTVADGETYLSEAMTQRSQRNGAAPAGKHTFNVETLSDRELVVFELIGEGRNIHEIAEKMMISPKTVDAHRQRIKRKLGLDDNVELSRFAIEWAMTR